MLDSLKDFVVIRQLGSIGGIVAIIPPVSLSVYDTVVFRGSIDCRVTIPAHVSLLFCDTVLTFGSILCHVTIPTHVSFSLGGTLVTSDSIIFNDTNFMSCFDTLQCCYRGLWLNLRQ